MPAGNLTISIGVASISGNIKINVDDIVKSADEALYKAKFLRKNRVERYYSILDDLQNSVGNDDKEIIISIKTLIAVIDAKDKYTFGHVERVVSYCLLMAEQLEFDEQTKKNLIYAAYMHDIGKINIPEEILVKNTNLTLEEWEILKAHPITAWRSSKTSRN
jgi:HD-GYP domain-containing protein (c-di-GMP phosphodiesterase class II)